MLARRAAILCARFHGAGRWWRALICMMLGGVIALGQAPTDLWWLALAGLAVAMALTDTSVTARRGFGVMWWIGAGYFAVALRWIVAPFLVDPAQTGWMAPFAIVLMAAGAGLFWGAAGWLSVRFGRAQWPGLVLALTLTEAVRALVLTGFPWALVGHIWIETPLVQAAASVGPHGLTLLALAVAWALSRVVFGRWRLTMVPLAAVALAVALVLPLATLSDMAPPLLTAFAANRVGDDLQGLVQGVIASLASVAAIAAPLVLTGVFEHFVDGDGLYFPGAPFIVAALLTLVTVPLILRLKPSDAE